MSARLTTEVWVSALLRRVFAKGGFAAIERRGSSEAGSVFVIVRGRGGEIALYEPAPQSSYGEGRPQERYFSRSQTVADAEALSKRLQSEMRFDPDVWVVEIEPGSEPVETLISTVE